MYVYTYVCVYMYMTRMCDAAIRCHFQACTYVCMYVYTHVCMLENITTETRSQDISADILRVWLSGYILQQCMYIYICVCIIRMCDAAIRCLFLAVTFVCLSVYKYVCVYIYIYIYIYIYT